MKSVAVLVLICLSSVLASRYNEYGPRFDNGPPQTNREFPHYGRPESEYFERGYDIPREQGRKSNIITLPEAATIPPAVTKSAEPNQGLVSIVSSCALSVAKSALGMIVKVPALIFGSVIAFGICHLTPICGQLQDMDVLLHAKREIFAYATPERIAKASDLVDKVVRKYRSLTNN